MHAAVIIKRKRKRKRSTDKTIYRERKRRTQLFLSLLNFQKSRRLITLSRVFSTT
jgi:hypothetical protein